MTTNKQSQVFDGKRQVKEDCWEIVGGWFLQLDCNIPSGESIVFGIGGGCRKVGPIALKRKLLSAYWYEGKCCEFNFSKFWTFTRTKFDGKEMDTQIVWHVEQKTWRNRMVTDITCEKKDMLLVNYEAPNGKKLT